MSGNTSENSECRYVLIVENEAAYAKLLKTGLEKEGYEIDISVDGADAIKSISERAPDLIVLDLLLPGKSGYDVLEVMQKDEKLRKVKVLVLSNLGQKVEIERAFKLGVMDFVIKTDIALGEMIKKVKHFCPNEPVES